MDYFPVHKSNTFYGWLAGLAVLLAALAYAWLTTTLPSDGISWRPEDWTSRGIRISVLSERPGGLKSGDILVGVGEETLATWAQALLSPRFPRPTWQVGQWVEYTVERDNRLLSIPVQMQPSSSFFSAGINWSTIAFVGFLQIVGAYVYLRRPADRAARVLFITATAMLAFHIIGLAGVHIPGLVRGLPFWLYRGLGNLFYSIFLAGLIHFTLVFPSPHWPGGNRPWLPWLLYMLPIALYILFVTWTYFSIPNPILWLGAWKTGQRVTSLLYLVMAAISMYWGYRQSKKMVDRLKIRWVVLGSLVSIGSGTILWILPSLAAGAPLIGENMLGLLLLPFPVSLAIAILRYRIFDITYLLNRAMIYTGMSAIVAGIYIFFVGTLGEILQARTGSPPPSNLALSLLATALVAVLLQPLREQLQRIANRLMYGERDDPYTALSNLGQSLKSTMNPESILPAVVETVVRTLKLPYAAIALRQGEGFRLVAEFGRAPAAGRPAVNNEAFPLIYQSETVGQLILGQRSLEDTFNTADRQLIESISDQVGITAHAFRLADDLQQSRERLVTTREEERRRLRRDLHDGIGSILASLSFNLDAAYNLLYRDPQATGALLTELKTQTRTAMDDIRRLAYDLRPPVLDELGFAAAVREMVKGYNRPSELCVELELPEHIYTLSAAAEVAAYRIIVEALNNVQRHAQAHRCLVRLSIERSNTLCMEICDDGQGLPVGWNAGVGISGMRERASELGGSLEIFSTPGGGACVTAALPIIKESSWKNSESSL